MKFKLETAIFLVACLIAINLSVLVKAYCNQPKETITEAVTEETTVQEITETTEPPTKYISLGTFKITAYDPCTDCSGKWGTMTATGVTAKAGRTIAVDPSVIPYGTEVIINGHTYIAEDCGGAVKGNTIDIFFDTHEEVQRYGRQYAEVFWAK